MPARNLQAFISDRKLLPRIEQYACNNDIHSIPTTVEYLRQNYFEYRRKQLGPFTRLVSRAVSVLKHRLQDEEEEESEIVGSARPASVKSRKLNQEDRLVLVEDEHLCRRRVTLDGSGSENGRQMSELQSGSGSISSENNVVEDQEIWETETSSDSREDNSRDTYNLLNSSLRATYSRSLERPINMRPLQVVKVNTTIPMATQAQENEGKTNAINFKSLAAGKSPQAQEIVKQSVDENTNQSSHIPNKPLVAPELPQANKRARDQSEADRESERSLVGKRGRKLQARSKNAVRADPPAVSKAAVPERVSFADLGGLDATLDAILEIIYPLKCPQVYRHLGVAPSLGLLLHGPPGCGKTKLANAIAYEANLPFLKLSAPEVVSGISGESEAKLRSLFAEASLLAPCVVFIDEIDAIMSKREVAQREMERRIVTQLMTCMDELQKPVTQEDGNSTNSSTKSGYVLVIGATNRPEALDPALRRPGRFDREIEMEIPDEKARAKILSVLIKNLRVEGSLDIPRIASKTSGFVGADLVALTKEAASAAIRRIIASRMSQMDLESLFPNDQVIEENSKRNNIDADRLIGNSQNIVGDCVSETISSEKCSYYNIRHLWDQSWTDKELMSISIIMQDFEEAVCKVQPSTKREGFTSVPTVSWEDVGSLYDVREELECSISMRIKEPKIYDELLMEKGTGFLLYGPPGCGKTLVAKAVANSAGANFLYVKGPELLNKYLGESERAVRQLFSHARACVPSIIFFDEVDALAPRRGNDGNSAAERVVNQLLIEMDGLDQRKGIFYIAATNRVDMVDPALLRPGRLDKLIYIPLPDMQGRVSILKALTRAKPLAQDVNTISIAENKRCDGFSGADMAALVNAACIACVKECRSDNTIPAIISQRHFEEALTKVCRSVSIKDLRQYEGSCSRVG